MTYAPVASDSFVFAKVTWIFLHLWTEWFRILLIQTHRRTMTPPAGTADTTSCPHFWTTIPFWSVLCTKFRFIPLSAEKECGSVWCWETVCQKHCWCYEMKKTQHNTVKFVVGSIVARGVLQSTSTLTSVIDFPRWSWQVYSKELLHLHRLTLEILFFRVLFKTEFWNFSSNVLFVQDGSFDIFHEEHTESRSMFIVHHWQNSMTTVNTKSVFNPGWSAVRNGNCNCSSPDLDLLTRPPILTPRLCCTTPRMSPPRSLINTATKLLPSFETDPILLSYSCSSSWGGIFAVSIRNDSPHIAKTQSPTRSNPKTYFYCIAAEPNFPVGTLKTCLQSLRSTKCLSSLLWTLMHLLCRWHVTWILYTEKVEPWRSRMFCCSITRATSGLTCETGRPRRLGICRDTDRVCSARMSDSDSFDQRNGWVFIWPLDVPSIQLDVLSYFVER